MDFSDHPICLPCEVITLEKRQRNLRDICKDKLDSTDTEQNVNTVHVSHISKKNYASLYKLFYDGKWQKPVKGMYWKHNDSLWANATNDDITRCCKSAEKGFKAWSVNSIKIRIQILSNLVSTLKLNRKLVLADIVERWLKFPYLFDTVYGGEEGNSNTRNMRELTRVHMPLGIIILREENENVLFFRLIQTLIAGNSVIVIFDANFYNLTQYCDMFSTCGIPPGVINLLSHEDINTLEYKLCSTTYTDYANSIFSKDQERKRYTESYCRLTRTKKIYTLLK